MNTKPSVQFVTISDEAVNQRIDNFLFTLLKGVPKSLIYRNIRKGNVRVNKKRVKPEYRLLIADIVRIPPLRQADREERKPSDQLVTLLENSILYENQEIIAINKPYGLAVHAGSGVALGLIETLRYMRTGENSYLQLVHRLDRETSGCLLIAKSRTALLDLQNLFNNHRISKVYLALTKGSWQNSVNKVSMPLRKNIEESGERLVKADSDGKVALTEFMVKQAFTNASLMEVHLQTGRTHQIRVHAQQSGHPIAGDPKYGDTEFNKTMRRFGLRRLFLHAESLTFKLPGMKKSLQLTAPLTEELQQVLLNLEN